MMTWTMAQFFRTGGRLVSVAVATLTALNPSIAIEPIEARVSADNAAELVDGHDLVVDGSDNFSARYAVNDACVAARSRHELSHDGVSRFREQLGRRADLRKRPSLMTAIRSARSSASTMS